VRVTKNVDTADPTLPVWPPPPDRGTDPGGAWSPEPEPRRRRRFTVVAATVCAVVVLAGLVAGLVRIPYDTLSPGSSKVVNDIITVHGHDVYPPSGKILYTTVSVRERVSVLQALLGWLDPTTDVVSEKEIRGNIPANQYEQLNVQAMTDSTTTAEALALSHIGYTNLGVGAQVDSVADGSPAAGVLEVNDLIVQIDGQPVKNTDDAVALIRAHQPGDTLHLQVTRGGMPTDLSTTLTRAPDGTARVGVQLSTRVQLPFEISIDSGQVVGPSAGLSYALELLDVLTPGELTGGTKVAATGELGTDGSIGPIGGIAQKVVSVKRAGAKVFLVPKDNVAAARAHSGKGLAIIGVSTFDDALKALGSMRGSNALALAKPPSGA
jgi:PDZ domain-containing protein